jgi:glyoxylase-like metal-dependent hydrolase (beta-lactamase superfamily II)
LIFQPVTDHVFAIVGPPARANVAAFLLPESVVLIDCGIQLSAARDVRREIEEIAGRKVGTVILTHFHSDHTHALPAFHDCRIISSNRLLKNLKLAKRSIPEGFPSTLPNTTFGRQLELRDGGIRLVIKQSGGHTDCSTYVFCPDYRTLAAGDNLWTAYHPWGGARGGDPDVWIHALEEYLVLNADFFVPGHGPIGSKDSVRRLLDYLNNVGDVMKEMIALRKKEAEVLRAGGEVPYSASEAGHPHISTLKKWYRIWRARTNQSPSSASSRQPSNR